MATTMAIGEEGGHYPYPIITPIEQPVTVTTMAVGEEGGDFALGM